MMLAFLLLLAYGSLATTLGANKKTMIRGDHGMSHIQVKPDGDIESETLVAADKAQDKDRTHGMRRIQIKHDGDTTQVSALQQAVARKYEVLAGQHCGGPSISEWSDGSNSLSGQEGHSVEECKVICDSHASQCLAFVWGTIDGRCFWKGSPLAPYTSAVYDCYQAEAIVTCDVFVGCKGTTKPSNKGTDMSCLASSTCNYDTCCEECTWVAHANKYSAQFAGGTNAYMTLAHAKATCIQLGVEVCKAITCEDPETVSCTVRASSSLTDSTGGETTYVPDTACFEAEALATCDSFLYCNEALAINKGNSTQCSGTDKSSCDAPTCCEAKATCDTFSACSGATPFNQGSRVMCPHAAICDAGTCCEACKWSENEDRSSSGYANGITTQFTFKDAKGKCIELGKVVCKAITCESGGTCTVRASSELGTSTIGETTYVRDATCDEVESTPVSTPTQVSTPTNTLGHSDEPQVENFAKSSTGISLVVMTLLFSWSLVTIQIEK